MSAGIIYSWIFFKNYVGKRNDNFLKVYTNSVETSEIHVQCRTLIKVKFVVMFHIEF